MNSYPVAAHNVLNGVLAGKQAYLVAHDNIGALGVYIHHHRFYIPILFHKLPRQRTQRVRNILAHNKTHSDLARVIAPPQENMPQYAAVPLLIVWRDIMLFRVFQYKLYNVAENFGLQNTVGAGNSAVVEQVGGTSPLILKIILLKFVRPMIVAMELLVETFSLLNFMKRRKRSILLSGMKRVKGYGP